MEVDKSKVFNAEYDKNKFPTALYTTAEHGIISFSEQIYDLTHNENQCSINDKVNDLTTKSIMKINGVDVKYGDDVSVNGGNNISSLTDEEVDELFDNIFKK